MGGNDADAVFERQFFHDHFGRSAAQVGIAAAAQFIDEERGLPLAFSMKCFMFFRCDE